MKRIPIAEILAVEQWGNGGLGLPVDLDWIGKQVRVEIRERDCIFIGKVFPAGTRGGVTVPAARVKEEHIRPGDQALVQLTVKEVEKLLAWKS